MIVRHRKQPSPQGTIRAQRIRFQIEDEGASTIEHLCVACAGRTAELQNLEVSCMAVLCEVDCSVRRSCCCGERDEGEVLDRIIKLAG